jgi:glyoxylase-like metal-dependent hydrolase (beta-lactamase superfamily II)
VSPPRVALHLFQVGSCRQLERVTLRGGRWRIIEFPALVALILHPAHGPILYDTGYADHFTAATRPFPERLYRWLTPVRLPAEERLGAQLGRFGLRLTDVERVLISHLHADHVAGLRDLPRAGFMALAADVAGHLGRERRGDNEGREGGEGGEGRGDLEARQDLEGREGLEGCEGGDGRMPAAGGGRGGRRTAAGAWRFLRRGELPDLLPPDFAARLALADEQPAADLGPAWAPFERGFDLLGDGSLIGIPLPGHSPAQLGVLLRTEEDRPVLLAADACWSARAWREQRLPACLVRPLFADWPAYRRTLAGLRQVAERHPDLAIVPSHCAATLAGLAVPRSADAPF